MKSREREPDIWATLAPDLAAKVTPEGAEELLSLYMIIQNQETRAGRIAAQALACGFALFLVGGPLLILLKWLMPILMGAPAA